MRTGLLGRRVRRTLTVACAAGLFVPTVLVGTAFGHGSTIDPPSRHYGCYDRWGDDFQNPAMETEDPMCWQAWQAEPNAMWNWKGLLLNGVGGDHRAAVPDGQLCSAGRDRYAALDKPGAWKTTDISNNFSVTVQDAAVHGADYYRIFVTKQGFDPKTQRLGWGDLELVAETGYIPPGEGEQSDNEGGGVEVTIDANAPGRSGHHIVYMIWKASHMDQTFYACSDVNFTG